MSTETRNISPEEFDAKPGEITMSSEDTTPSTGEPGTEAHDTDTNPETEEVEVDVQKLLEQNEKFKQENKNLQILVGRQGGRIGELERSLNQTPPAAPLTQGGVAESELDDDDFVTRADLKRWTDERRKEEYLLAVGRQDSEFLMQQQLPESVVQTVRQYQGASGILSFRDAFYSLQGQGVLSVPESKRVSRRTVGVTPKRSPTQTGAAPRAGAGVEPATGGNRDPYEGLTAEQILDRIRREQYPEMG